MKVTILGTGNIGGTLGRGWAGRGHEVIFGAREVNAAKVKELLATIEGRAEALDVAEAIAAGEIIVFAIPGAAVDEAVAAYAAGLNGKIVIDAANKVGQADMSSLPAFSSHAPQAKYFRAFSNLGWENFAEPVINGVQADLFYCGDEGQAQTDVEGLITDIGLRPIYVGGREAVGVIDNLTRLWFTLVWQRGYDRHLAFKMLVES